MRRTWAAGAAILATLALGGGPTLAQSLAPAATSQPTWAAVTGTGTCAPPSGGTVHLESAPYAVTGAVFACTDTASDARVTGPSTMTFTC